MILFFNKKGSVQIIVIIWQKKKKIEKSVPFHSTKIGNTKCYNDTNNELFNLYQNCHGCCLWRMHPKDALLHP